jgi:protein farnesyltransferase/geranylgeranyltransferase type-1 subunit alpha
LKHLKNYQIWNHRQTIIDQLGSPEGEADFVDQMLKADSKNYHVWSYRQWLVQRFDLFSDEAELNWVDKMISEDVRNNSAWNHRFFLVFGNQKDGKEVGDGIVQRDVE